MSQLQPHDRAGNRKKEPKDSTGKSFFPEPQVLLRHQKRTEEEQLLLVLKSSRRDKYRGYFVRVV